MMPGSTNGQMSIVSVVSAYKMQVSIIVDGLECGSVAAK